MLIPKSYGKAAHFGYYRSEQGLSAVQEAPRAEIRSEAESDLDRHVEGAQGGKVDEMLVCAVEGGFVGLDSRREPAEWGGIAGGEYIRAAASYSAASIRKQWRSSLDI